MSNPVQSPAQTLCDLYTAKGLDFWLYARKHIEHGFFFATPDYCVMGRPVCRSWPDEDVRNPEMSAPRIVADAWFIHAMSGDTSKAWDVLPWPLGWIGFERFDASLRWVPTELMRKFHPATINDFDNEQLSRF